MRSIKKSLHHFFVGGDNFKKEFRRQMRLLIIITLGFTIAFTWRQTVFDISQEIVSWITHIQESALSSVLTSTFITLISLIVIYITSKLLKDKPDFY